jgi:hypothetical protein
MDNKRIAQFEERIQSLVEGSFTRLFGGRLRPREVAQRLARVMENETRPDVTGRPVAPNRYLVHLTPEDSAALLAAQPDLPAKLAEHLLILAQEADFRLDVLPRVEFVPDDTLTAHTLLVRAEHAVDSRQSTQMMEPLDLAAKERLPQAFLVVDGNRYVPLDRSVINIGRRRDNSIVLDDPRVSRQHCQLRYRLGQFILYDLGSRGGTFVNNLRVTECVLRAGDVISLAGVPVVYMLDESTTGRWSGGDTQARLSQDDLQAE